MGIAEELEIEYSTIYREIKRGINADGYYDADYAQKKYDEGHKRKGRPKRQLDKNTELYKYLKQKIVDEKKSPGSTLAKIKADSLEFDDPIPSKPKLYRMIREGEFE